MTDFDEMVAFLEQEKIHWGLAHFAKGEGFIEKYTLKARFGLTKDFYVDFDKKKCSMWHQELADLDIGLVTSLTYMGTDFKTHVQIQKELDRIL